MYQDPYMPFNELNPSGYRTSIAKFVPLPTVRESDHEGTLRVGNPGFLEAQLPELAGRAIPAIPKGAAGKQKVKV